MNPLEQATALRTAGRLPEAMDAFRLAVKQDPLNPELWYQTAMAAIDIRDYRYAASMLEAYLRFQPGRPGPFFDLAYCQMRLGDYAGAARSLERTVALRPNHPRALIALGQMLYALGRPDEAYAAHSQALVVEGDSADDRAACSIVRLLRGDYERGWPDFEYRWATKTFHGVPTWPAGARHWRGERTPGQTVYVHAEGGYGDTLMFGRYLPLVSERVDRLVLVVQPALERLIAAALPGRYEFAENAVDAPPEAAHVSTWSLPQLFGTRLDTLPAAVPYLHLGDDAPVRPSGGRLRVGIAWAGNRVTTHDLDRSCPDPTLLDTLFAVPGVDWVSLQVGEETVPAGIPVAPCPIRGDFVDTARLVRGLDLVISVDTAVAHLSGALAVPTWVMVPAMPEFRWLLDRDTSPWYPHHRLFRRGRTDDWTGIAARMAPELTALATARASS